MIPDSSRKTGTLKLAVVTAIAAYIATTQQTLHLTQHFDGGSGGILISALSTAAIAVAATYFLWDQIGRVAGGDTLAYVDALTGLPNRRQFDARLKGELARSGEGCAILYLYLDRFKHINDSYGHEAGDAVIQQFGSRIASTLRGEDMVARLAGDEFAAIVSRIASSEEVEIVAARIFKAMAEPVQFREKLIYPGVSIGAAIVHDETLTPEEALRRADFALFQAKEAGRNNLQIFSAQMEEEIRTRALLENDLREAIVRNRFEIAYQPLVSQETRKVLGVEAFVRWTHPERGVISPAVFIPIAERIGMIDRLGEIILRQACTEIRPLRHLKLAVNISSLQFQQRSFVPGLRKILEETGMDPARLELEVKEEVFRSDPGRTKATISKLRALGVRIAIDDFGTGISTMAYLRDFPLDRIKIDRSFISEIENSDKSLSLVSHMIELGSSLGLSVTVEGVETDEQLALLKAKGLTELQGYLFSKPLSGDELRSARTDAGADDCDRSDARRAHLRLVS